MNVYTTDKIRNVVLLGHGGSGKTTMVEAMAYLAGITNRMGKVADGNTISDCTVNNVVVWETTQEDTVTNRVYAGAFAGTFLDNGGKNCPTLRRCEFTGEIYSGEDKTDVLEANRYVGSLWYGAEVPATVNIEDCVIHMP